LHEARDDGVWGWQWHRLDHMQTICTSLQTDNHTNTSSLHFYMLHALLDALPTVSKHCNTHPFNGPLSGTTQMSRYQKGKTDLDFTEARDSEWQWRQLGHMQVCISIQTDNHASTPPLKFFTGWMPFLAHMQHRQSTEGTCQSTVKY